MDLLNRIKPPLLPLIQVFEHLLDNPFSHGNNKRSILKNRDKLHRSDFWKALITPAKKRLTACTLSGLGIYNRLHDD